MIHFSDTDTMFAGSHDDVGRSAVIGRDADKPIHWRADGQPGKEGRLIMEAGDIATLAVGVAILAFLWSLHGDIAELRERMARLEGPFEGFTKGDPARV